MSEAEKHRLPPSGTTGTITDSPSAWFGVKIGHYLAEYGKGAVDSMAASGWQRPFNLENPGFGGPLNYEELLGPYQSPFDPAQTAEDQFARDLGATAPILLSLAGAKVGPWAIPGAAARTVPRGFVDAAQFGEATANLEMALAKSGITDASIGVRGSSVTGVSAKTGKPFGPKSDIDFFVESRQLTKGLPTSKNTPGFVHPDKIAGAYDPIADWSAFWSEVLGRKVTVGGFQPGTLPVGPVIRP
jgi:hypothetical protein